MWVVEFLDDDALAEYLALPEDMQAKFSRISNMIETLGLSKVHEPYIKHITGKLWENALDWQRRHRTVPICHGKRKTGRCVENFHQEDADDASS